MFPTSVSLRNVLHFQREGVGMDWNSQVNQKETFIRNPQ